MATRNLNAWGPKALTHKDIFRGHIVELDEDYAEEYTERMMSAQMRQLDPLKEDLAEWINKTLGINYVSRDNFLSELDNGVILCHLAKYISDKAQYAIQMGHIEGPAPKIRSKCFEKAMRRSFFSRDNMENFIKFCKSMGVHENLLFESDDLVMHNQPRNVILCLLEVARLATSCGVEPPGLIQLEKEIAEEENNQSTDSGIASLLSWQFQASMPRIESDNKIRHGSSGSAISPYDHHWDGPQMVILPEDNVTNGNVGHKSISGASDGVPSDNTEDEWSRGSGEDPDSEAEPASGCSRKAVAITTELDRKVQQATRMVQKNCNCAENKCSKLSVRKVGEGKYNIAGRNVFVRLLKGRHMMVRVGGGWDTLDHFLLRHDPCQVKVVSRVSKDTTENESTANNASKYLHIRAKYRSPPPREPITR